MFLPKPCVDGISRPPARGRRRSDGRFGNTQGPLHVRPRGAAAGALAPQHRPSTHGHSPPSPCTWPRPAAGPPRAHVPRHGPSGRTDGPITHSRVYELAREVRRRRRRPCFHRRVARQSVNARGTDRSGGRTRSHALHLLVVCAPFHVVRSSRV
jgi:hypothetical protein